MIRMTKKRAIGQYKQLSLFEGEENGNRSK